MITRIRIWAIRRKARIISKSSQLYIHAKLHGVTVGTFKNGREVR